MAESGRGMTRVNTERRIDGLRRKRDQAHDYRVKVWAERQQAINGMEEEIRFWGGELDDLFQPDFTDPTMLDEYQGIAPQAKPGVGSSPAPQPEERD